MSDSRPDFEYLFSERGYIKTNGWFMIYTTPVSCEEYTRAFEGRRLSCSACVRLFVLRYLVDVVGSRERIVP